MKIPKAVKLPSGSWYVNVMVKGKRLSITAPTKREAENEAAAIKSGAKAMSHAPLSVTQALDRYIDSKSAVLSPATVAGYRRIQKNLFVPIADYTLSGLTQEQVQRWVNQLVKQGKKPKTVSNAHGLLSAVIGAYRPEMVLRTTLPQKVKPEISIPTEAELSAIFEMAKGTKYELPIMLAVWMGLRASEIRGLRWEDINGEYITVKRAIVEGESGPVEKGTKTFSGTRTLHLPPYLADLIQQQDHAQDHIVTLSGHAMYNGFGRICEKAGVPHFRFHDLRHMNASVMLAAGIPNKYAQERIGHATDNMLKTVYQHTIQEEQKKYSDEIDQRFEALFHLS
nr:MAG TPA: Integrase [Caudoviricetes sp.]